MKILAFDISSNHCSISVLDKNGDEIGNFYENMIFGQAEVLLPNISSVLEDCRLDIKKINLIAVSVGPGSFTGIRAGIATARSLALALGVPAIGVSTLEAYFKQLKEKKDKNLVVIETKRADFYYQIFDKEGKAICEANTGFTKDILDILGDDYCITGDGKPRFTNEAGIDEFVGNLKIDAKTVGLVALEKYMGNKSKINKNPKDFYPKPLYLRAATVRR